MSSIPKAMKFLQVHYETLIDLYQTLVGALEKVYPIAKSIIVSSL